MASGDLYCDFAPGGGVVEGLGGMEVSGILG